MSRFSPSPPDTAARLGIHHNGIHWTDLTRNVSEGCERVSPACMNCWAEGVASTRLSHIPGAVGDRYREVTDERGWNRKIVADPARIPLAFRGIPRTVKGVDDAPRQPRVWVGSMTDLFHADVPDTFLDRVFAEMAARPQVYQVLTKRSGRQAAYAASRTRRGLAWPSNVWAGVTVEDQERVQRVADLATVPAAVRFVSVEPMLSAINLSAVRVPDVAAVLTSRWEELGLDRERYRGIPGRLSALDGRVWPDGAPEAGWLGSAGSVEQVIIGSESNGNRPGDRETREEWVIDLIGQCDRVGAAVFLKQIAIGDRLISLPLIDGRPRADFPA